jgi:hypothetical protein
MTEQSTPVPDLSGDPEQGASGEALGGLTVEDDLTPEPDERGTEHAGGVPADDLQADEAHDFTGEVTRP